MTDVQSVHRSKPRKRKIVANSQMSAADTIGPITPGIELFGLTHGQFSFIDIAEHVVSQIGPCHAVISTWTAAGASIRKAESFMKTGRLLSMQWIIDRSFLVRQPVLCELIASIFGSDAIRSTRCHAKFLILHNERFKIVIRTSMNLNQNPRVEDFEISDDPALCEFMLDLTASMFGAEKAGDNFSNRQNELEKFALPETSVIKTKEQPICLPLSPLHLI